MTALHAGVSPAARNAAADRRIEEQFAAPASPLSPAAGHPHVLREVP